MTLAPLLFRESMNWMRKGNSFGGRARSGVPHRRRMQIEWLENRHLLAITVDTLVDENDGIGVGGISLREAIAAASPSETIEFAPALTSTGPATIRLTRGELRISNHLTINGPGAELLTIDSSGNDPTPNVNEGNGSRLFNITDGANSLKSITMRRLTLTGGDSSGPGGAILARENLTLVDCVITGNATFTNSQLGGGGIYSATNSSTPNSLTLIGCTISSNAAVRDEGGGLRKRYGSLVMEDCTVRDNIAGTHGGGLSGADGLANIQIHSSTFIANSTTRFHGGGIFIYSGVFTLEDSTVSGNSATHGGGIYLGTSSQGTVKNSAITNNVADNDGGGVFVFSSQLTITGSTVSGNSAEAFGGGVAVPTGTFVMRHSTVTNNRSDTDLIGAEHGGGVILGTTSTLTLDHSIVAENFRSATRRSDVFGAVAARFSLIGDNTLAAIFDNGGNLMGNSNAPIDPRLGPLAHNGGPTMTHALLPSSPALDAGDPNFVPPPDHDQRGLPRVADGHDVREAGIDIGAYESQGVPSFNVADYNRDTLVGLADYTLYRDTLGSTTDLRADGDGNGVIDKDDYDVWKANFGQGLSFDAFGASAAASDTDVAALDQAFSAFAPTRQQIRRSPDVELLGVRAEPDLTRANLLLVRKQDAADTSARDSFEANPRPRELQDLFARAESGRALTVITAGVVVDSSVKLSL